MTRLPAGTRPAKGPSPPRRRRLRTPVLGRRSAIWPCPCSRLRIGTTAHSRPSEPGAEPSALTNWPVQLHLVPPGAPFLKDADLLLVADCVPFALADFHRRYLRGRPVVIGCPKLDNAPAYVEKLTQMLEVSAIRSLTVIHMEVPCCTGLVRTAQAAVAATGARSRLMT